MFVEKFHLAFEHELILFRTMSTVFLWRDAYYLVYSVGVWGGV